MGRGANVPRENLKDFKGYLQTDGYVVYGTYGVRDGIVHPRLAHAHRTFEKALDNDRERASVVLKLMQQLYAVEQLARDGNGSVLKVGEQREKTVILQNKYLTRIGYKITTTIISS